MTITAVIAEYNPFHNGHLYQIEEAKKQTHADYMIVIMSGNFVQRGAPAIQDKYIRTQAALQNGADLVIELPTLWATSSSDYFARGALSILNGLGIVDYLCFGTECDNLSLLYTAADLFYNEPEEFKELLSNNLKGGLSFPIARAQAARTFLSNHGGLDEEAVETIIFLINEPNNILAISYLSALMVLSSPIKPIPIKRKGQSYHENELAEQFSSATAIRSSLKTLLSNDELYHNKEGLDQFLHLLSQNVPENNFDQMVTDLLNKELLFPDDFSSALSYKLLSIAPGSFSDYADAGSDLGNRAENLVPEFVSFSDFCTLLKTKRTTHTRVSRYLTHLLLNVTEGFRKDKVLDGYCPYARILGFRKTSTPLLNLLHKNTQIPIITNLNADMEGLSKTELDMLHLDIFASDLYHSMLTQKTKKCYPNEFTRALDVH